jgi:RNA polymerase sigma factor (sigma-70 family)
MEASALTHASRLGLLGRRSPLLRLQGDERLIALIRDGQERGFEALVERYRPRLHAFCRGMLGSSEDAEDVLQEVFVAAHAAILADQRPINARPWLYRIARNRCLNHLRKPVPEGQDSMDIHPHENGASVVERVQRREDFRELIADVQCLPDTQRTALLLREIDAMSYEEIAQAMETTVPAVKSLLVRARMALTDSTQGRHMTCDEVHLELAEAVEGLRKASGPARSHLKRCEPCRAYRAALRRNERALAALAPVGLLGPLAALVSKLGFGGAKAGTGAGAGAGASGAAGGTGAALSGAAAGGSAGGLGLAGGAAAGGLGGLIGGKAVAGMASVALLTAGAVEVNHLYDASRDGRPAGSGTSAGTATLAFAGPTVRAMAGGRAATGPNAHEARRDAASPPEAAEPSAPVTPVEPVGDAPAEEALPADGAGDGGASGPPSDAVAGEPESGTGTAGPDSGGVISDFPPATDPDDPPPPADGEGGTGGGNDPGEEPQPPPDDGSGEEPPAETEGGSPSP